LIYTQGSDQILVALEAELEGLTAGDQKTVDLDAVNGYGEVNAEAFQEVPLGQLPEDARVVGAMLQAQGFPGPLRVTEIKEDVAVLDFNHPLAGKDLSFDITIVAVEDAPPPPANPLDDIPALATN
jgi:FKBP-type peptidyl-prolyl cis-trans isomerase 2